MSSLFMPTLLFLRLIYILTIMITNKDIQTLAELARLEVSQDQCAAYADDFNGILSYIDTLSQVEVSSQDQNSQVVVNVVREDDSAYAPESFTDVLMKSAPDTKDGYLKVPKIL